MIIILAFYMVVARRIRGININIIIIRRRDILHSAYFILVSFPSLYFPTIVVSVGL